MAHNMNAAPDNEASKGPQHKADDGERDPTPGEILSLVGKWLRQRLEIAADKPKWTDVLTVFLTLLIAAAAFCSAWIFQGQLTVARQTMEAQTRPWVGNGKIEVKETTFLVYPDNPIRARTQVDLVIEVPLKNVGNSPALNVETSVIATMTEQIGAFPTVEPMMESACGGADKNAKAVGQVLFPNSPDTTVEWPMDVMTPFIQINQVHRVWIDICVTYSGTTSDQQIHHTKIWMASWPIDNKPTEIRRTTQPTVIYYALPITQWGVIKIEAD